MLKIKRIIASLFITLSLGATVAVAVPTQTHAATRNALTGCVGGSVLTFPCWYKGLTLDALNNPRLTSLNDFWTIALNVIEMFLQIVAYFSVGYIVWGGFKYMKSQGNPQNIASAKSTLMNAAIGLGLGLSAVALVNFVGATIR